MKSNRKMEKNMKMRIFVIVQLVVRHGYQKKKGLKDGEKIKKKNGRSPA